MMDEVAWDGAGAGRPGEARGRRWRGSGVPTLQRRQGGRLIVRWIGAVNRRKPAREIAREMTVDAAAARVPPADVIVLAEVRASRLGRQLPTGRSAARGGRGGAATLLPFVRPA